MLKKNIQEMFRRFEAREPEPKGELDYVNVFTLLVAVVLSAQATDVGVNKATKALFALADSPEKMAALGLEAITKHVRTIGLYRNKAKNVLALSLRLIEVFNSQVPDRREDLESLAGVGRKTANVVLNLYFGQPTIAVDTHIFRLSNRLKLAPAKNVVETERKLEKAIPARYKRHSHHWLILHGRYVCKARKPLCNNCIIADLCNSSDKVI
ncbi:MAG: endonuclease III [Rhizobiales bacterium]|nr:endonuclease III [Hyphomicrobiales bacterium]NRB15220.1 endonuclease III [Hyphomicrobiales bacterium]